MMRHVTSLAVRAACVLVLAASPTAGALAADAPTAPEPYFSHPAIESLQLAPSGRRMAALAPVAGRVVLVVMDIDKREPRVAVRGDGEDIGWFAWVNDDRLVFALVDLQSGLNEQRRGTLHAVNHDGTELAAIGSVLARPTRFFATLVDGSHDILVAEANRNADYADIYRVDTKRPLRRTLLTDDWPGDPVRWVADRGGTIRGAVTVEKGTLYRSWWRAGADTKWQLIGEYPMGKGAVYPVTFDGDGSLIVSSAVGRDTAALHRFDAARNAPGELLAAHPHVDLLDGLVWDRAKRRIVGLRYEAAKPGYAWFDEDWARLASTIDQALPGRFNAISRGDAASVLVRSTSDRDPGTWYLLDTTKRKLEFLAVHRKAIDPDAMPRREPLRYKARDGLEIPAMLTLPAGREAKDLPLVLVVHGGPYVRGTSWTWRSEPAWLAAQGYAVLEPDFRGSTGWGTRHFTKGWKQWGREMQDDLLDGIDFLAARGTVDPRRVCIMGASYGGYAVMMGLARDPDRFRCGVNFLGVTDIEMLFDVTWSDNFGSDFMRFGAKTMIGDPDKESQRLREASPLVHAAKIRAPVLMAYGALDRRVPLVHGERMRDALRAQGTPVEWVVYAGEGHGFLREESRYDFYGRVAKFLAAHLAAK